MRIEHKLALVCVAIVGVAASCGGRSGTELYESDLLGPTGEGGWGGTYGVLDGSTKPDVSNDGSPNDQSVADTASDSIVPPKDASSDQKDFFDTIPPLPDSGPLGKCSVCLQGECGDEINACYNNDKCWSGVQCAVQKCFGGGGGGGAGGSGGGGGQIDMACMMDCFGGDTGSMMEALTMFQCITQTCAADCGFNGGGGAGGSAGANNNFLEGEPTHVLESTPRQWYVGAIRVPEPEEVAFSYPWLAEVLEGRPAKRTRTHNR